MKSKPAPKSRPEDGFEHLKYLIDAISHDMGAPLRAVVQFSRLLIEDVSDRLDDEQQHWLQLINENGDKAQAMLSALQRYSKLGALKKAEKSYR